MAKIIRMQHVEEVKVALPKQLASQWREAGLVQQGYLDIATIIGSLSGQTERIRRRGRLWSFCLTLVCAYLLWRTI
jgi:hypothetical protein